MIFHTESFTEACTEARRVARLYKCRVRVYRGLTDFYVLEDIYSSLLRGWLFLSHPGGNVTEMSDMGKRVETAINRRAKIIKLQDYRRH